jgi:hypothetical protein
VLFALKQIVASHLLEIARVDTQYLCITFARDLNPEVSRCTLHTPGSSKIGGVGGVVALF